MYSSLRHIRIVFSTAFLLLTTLSIIDSSFGITVVGKWLMRVQLIPAILLGAMGWLVLWVIVTITFGRVYCSTICPMGTVQDIASRLGHGISSKHPVFRCIASKNKKRFRYTAPVDMVRFSIPLIVAACLFVGFTMVVEATDPFEVYREIVLAIVRPAAIGLGGLACSLAILLIVSAVAWKRGRLLCNTICPAGGFLSLLGRQPIYRVDINTDLCIHCGKCEDVCKSECINLKDCVVDNSRCVMCMDCTAICPNNAIIVRRGRHMLSTPMFQPST